MRGLLLKDFALLKNQLYFIGMIVGMGILISFTQKSVEFGIGYVTVMGAILTLSTLSYDEYENGNAYLFSFPITRKEYVLEKYVLGILITGIGGIFVSVFLFVTAQVGNFSWKEIPAVFLGTAAASMVLMAVNLPIRLKFGTEKSKLVLILFSVSILGISYMASKAMNAELIEAIAQIGATVWSIVGILIVLLSLGISYKISVAIIESKEY